MLREKILSMENDLKAKSQKLAMYDQKLKQYGANIISNKLGVSSPINNTPIKVNIFSLSF